MATGSGGLAGVWAESNTREAIYDALRRKETYATSGTRLNIRFFGGWDYADDLPDRSDWVQGGVRGRRADGRRTCRRVPETAARRGSSLQAVKDPDGANLDRAQIVKVWRDGDGYRDQVYDVALSDGRTVRSHQRPRCL